MTQKSEVHTRGQRAREDAAEVIVLGEIVNLRKQIHEHAVPEQREQHGRERSAEYEETDLFDATLQIATACWNRDRLGHAPTLGQRN